MNTSPDNQHLSREQKGEGVQNFKTSYHIGNIVLKFLLIWSFALAGVSTQLQSSGLVAHENSTFRNLALAVSGPFMA